MKEEAKKWFKNIMMSCYLKTHKDYKKNNIFWIYNPLIIRQRKLNKLNGIEKEIKIKTRKNDELIFEQNIKTGYFWIKYEGYWTFLESNFGLNYKQIKELTEGVVNEVLNGKQYTTVFHCFFEIPKVNEVLNGKQYTTEDKWNFYPTLVNEVLNGKQYTTKYLRYWEAVTSE